MTTLAINTATAHTCIALLENGRIFDEASWLSHNDEAEKIMPSIDEILRKNGKNFKDITQVAVVRGPGSFTGLRIGVTVANTIAYLNNCPLHTLTTFDYFHLQSALPVLLFAGSGGVYLSKTSGDEPALINLSDLAEALKNIQEVTGNISAEQKSALKSTQFIEPTKTFGEVILEFLASNPSAQKIVEPLYIKEPSITKSKKNLCFT